MEQAVITCSEWELKILLTDKLLTSMSHSWNVCKLGRASCSLSHFQLKVWKCEAIFKECQIWQLKQGYHSKISPQSWGDVVQMDCSTRFGKLEVLITRYWKNVWFMNHYKQSFFGGRGGIFFPGHSWFWLSENSTWWVNFESNLPDSMNSNSAINSNLPLHKYAHLTAAYSCRKRPIKIICHYLQSSPIKRP